MSRKSAAMVLLNVCLVSVFALGSATVIRAQEGDKVSQAEMMQAYMLAAQPGEHHELLQKLAGTWKITTRSWMDPAGPPLENVGKEVTSLVLGGRFLRSEVESTFMGQPTRGLGLLGFDNVSEEYCGVWMDDMSTGMMCYTGSYDPESKTLTCTGTGNDAATGQQYTARLVTRIVSADEHVFEFFGTDPTGKEQKWMEILYERQ